MSTIHTASTTFTSLRKTKIISLTAGGIVALSILVSFQAIAQSSTSYLIEAETMNLSYQVNNGSITDSDASGGRAMLLARNTDATTSVTLPSASKVTFETRLRSTSCEGGPGLRISIDNKPLIDTIVTSLSWQSIWKDTEMSAGKHTITYTFDNDHYLNANCDRNIYVDYLKLTTPGTTVTTPAPTTTTQPTAPAAAPTQTTTVPVVPIQPASQAPTDTTTDTVLKIEGEAVKYARSSTGNDGTTQYAALYWQTEGKATITLPKAVDHMTVIAKGQSCKGAPHLSVLLNDTSLLEQDVASKNFTSYTSDKAIAAGTYTLVIRFTNDAYIPSVCDRNLYIDSLSFTTPKTSQNVPTTPPTTTPVQPVQPTPPVPAQPVAQTSLNTNAGNVRFMLRNGGLGNISTDSFISNPTTASQSWMRDHYNHMEVFTTYFDDKVGWYQNGLVYKDSYAIYRGGSLEAQHPDWILKDSSGNKLFIPWGCGSGTCPQYAADFGNQDYRNYWIAELKDWLYNRKYKGAWIDDVNMDFRVGNGNGTFVAPYDPRTKAPMTEDNWRKYMAEFMEQVRSQIPDKEILHNSLWFAGGYTSGQVRDANPYVKRQQAAANYINREGGFSDGGIGGGTGDWSLSALMSYIDRVHQQGESMVIDNFDGNDTQASEFSLATSLLVSNNNDLYGNMSLQGFPDTWNPLFSTALGNAKGARALQSSGVWKREFDKGIVLMNEPGAGASTKTIGLGGSYKDSSGKTVTSVTLGPRQGAVLVQQ